MKEKESTLANPPFISTTERATGNTTRLADHAIQLLFQDKIVIVEDHASAYLDTDQADKYLLDIVLGRLAFEHRIERKHVKLNKVNGKFELELI